MKERRKEGLRSRQERIANEILMHFRSQKKLQGEVSLADTLEAAGDGGSLSLMDVIAVDDDMLEQLDTLGTESRHLLADKGRCIQIFALHTLKLCLMYTLPYLCIRFMGLPCGLSFWQVQLLSSLMLFLSNALPNVAGMGSIETAFLLVFGSFMTRGEAMSTLMLFRIASYYFVFGFSAVASLFAQKHLDRMDAQKRS